MRCMLFLCDGDLNPDNFHELQDAIRTMSYCTTECERDFSLLNIITSDLRSSLTVTNIANLLFVYNNVPPLSLWN